MNKEALQKIQQSLGTGLWPRLRAAAIGLAQDYWKDGGAEPHPKTPVKRKARRRIYEEAAPLSRPDQSRRWHANRIAVIERIWGQGMSRPGDEALLDVLIAPLGLNREMNVLDLAAGLGGLARRIAKDYNAYVAGMEVDAEMAKRGMEISVEQGRAKHASVDHYDPASFVPAKHFDCFVARDIFYRIADRPKFFKAIALGLKPRGQLAFTDFILDPEHAENAAVRDWLAHDRGANPLSLADMTQAWAKLGFDVRVNEDQTKLYHAEIVKGLARFMLFLSKNPPDDETKPFVLHEIEKWGWRAKALEQGLKYCRFYAIKG